MQNTFDDLYTAFAQRVQCYPERNCLIDDSKSLTYAEALSAIDVLSSNLFNLGVRSGDCIAIYSQKSVIAVLYFLALSKLGCHIITLDLAFPEAQCLFVLSDASVDYILCESHFPYETDRPIFCADLLLKSCNTLANFRKENLSNWIVYSSGTTGNPKGIWISEQSMIHSFQKRESFSSYSPTDVIACSIYFYWEVFRPIIHGASVLILENHSILDFENYTKLIDKYNVSETLWTPSFAELFAKTASDEQILRLSTLQRVWLNGEVVSVYLYQLLTTRLPGIRFFNLYSISETFDISAFELKEGLSISQESAAIGKPLPNTELLLLRPDFSECLPGEKGELFVGGNSLAGGYLNQPEKEAASFIKLPQYPSSAYWFKTKDIAYKSEDESYHIIGRNDDIVKLRGYNVSLLSIEAVIKKHIPLRQCYVKLESSGKGDEHQIIAYLQPDFIEEFITKYDYDSESCHSPILYQILSKSLPHYSIPHSFRIVDNIQFNAYSAKLLRKNHQEIEDDPIKNLWQKCLNIPIQSITDGSDFFALGGTSLHAVQLVQYVNEQLDDKINIQCIYQNSRFHDFKGAIIGKSQSQSDESLIFEDIQWQPTSTGTDIYSYNLSNARRIFITGATGFLGIHWLHNLLMQTSSKIFCLVRCDSENEGQIRLENAFKQYNLTSNEWQQRVEIICGDLKYKHFGLNTSKWQRLISETDLVIHAAAQVNLMHEYANLRQSTILGTQTVLELATTHVIKPVYLISSDAVFNETNLAERESFLQDDSIDQLTYGYAQTKWVQERLIQQLNNQYQLPYLIIRLGNVAPSLLTKKSNPTDANGMVLSAVKSLKYQPDNMQIEFCPVDRLVAVLTDIGKTSFDNRIISLNGFNTVSSQKLKELLPDWQVEEIGFEDWQQALSQPFPGLYGLTSIPSLFTRQYETVKDLILKAPYTDKLQLSNTEIRDSLLTMAEQ